MAEIRAAAAAARENDGMHALPPFVGDPLAEPARFLSPAEVAELLAITPAEVQALIDSGELPAIRLGAVGLWRIERSELEGYIAGRYEEARRASQWNGSDLGTVIDLFG